MLHENTGGGQKFAWREKVGKLSDGERQSIAIGRAVHFGAKLLILEEPTSALSVDETRKILDYTRKAKARGLGVIFITIISVTFLR